MKVALVVISGKQAGLEIPVSKRRILIGRYDGCQIRLKDALVSGFHALLVLDDESLVIEDCQSATGTFVNEEYIQKPRRLSHGDRIRIGDLVLEVRVAGSAHSAKNPPVEQAPDVSVPMAVVDDCVANVPARFDPQAPGPWKSVPQPLFDPLALEYLNSAVGEIPVARQAIRPHGAQEHVASPQKTWGVVDLLLLAIVGVLAGALGLIMRCVVTTFVAALLVLPCYYFRSRQRLKISGRPVRFCLETVDLALMAAFIGLVAIGEFSLHWSPDRWAWYVGVLDPRNWSRLGWIGMATLWAAGLAAVRFWP